MIITRALVALAVASGMAACSASRPTRGVPAADTRYLYQLLDVRKLGADELARIEKLDPVIADFVARTGKPDFLIEPSLRDVQLVYYLKSLLVHFHQGTDGKWTYSELTTLPTSLIGVLPSDIRAGTPTGTGNEMTGCWATTIPGGSCQTCCTPPVTPAGQVCNISCK